VRVRSPERLLFRKASLFENSSLDTAFSKREYTVMQLVYEKPATKALANMQRQVATAIRAELLAIAVDPFAHHANVAPLTGTKAGFRLRHGDWRVLYRVDRATQTMIVENVKPRGEAYR
jgi:mRNA interferase RelE/StbE